MTGTVAVGLGIANIKGEKLLPGWQAGSFGYHADDGKVFLEEGSGKSYGPTYTVGDIIGCGITINNQLYFTKNGKNLGVACKLPKGKFFPVVGLDKASISTNFGKNPFLYDPFRDTSSSGVSFNNVTESTLVHILSFLDMKNVTRFARSNRGNYRVAMYNQIWKPLVLSKWPTVSLDLPVSSYYRFYKSRTEGLAGAGKKDPVLIENCLDWDFKCPVALNKIQRTHNDGVDFCNVCKKKVYLVHNMDELKQQVQQKQCVAIDFNNKEKNARRPQMPMPMIMGRMKVVR